MRILLILVLLAALAGCQKKPAATSTTGTASTSTPPAPAVAWSGNASDFQFASFAGQTQKLSSLAGKPVVLNFWADW